LCGVPAMYALTVREPLVPLDPYGVILFFKEL